MDDFNNTNDISNIIGMSGLFNNTEIDNSIKPKYIEKELIQNTLELDTFTNDEILNYNPINEYNSVFESLIDTPINKKIEEDKTEENDETEEIIDSNSDNFEIDNLINYSKNNYESSSFAYKLTEEQQNQKIVDNVLQINNNNNTQYNYNIDDENRDDLKLTLLEKIETLTEE